MTKRSCLKNATMKHFFFFFVCGYKNKGKERLVHFQGQPGLVGQLALLVKASLSLALSFPLNSSYLQRQHCAVWNTLTHMA